MKFNKSNIRLAILLIIIIAFICYFISNTPSETNAQTLESYPLESYETYMTHTDPSGVLRKPVKNNKSHFSNRIPKDANDGIDNEAFEKQMALQKKEKAEGYFQTNLGIKDFMDIIW